MACCGVQSQSSKRLFELTKKDIFNYFKTKSKSIAPVV